MLQTGARSVIISDLREYDFDFEEMIFIHKGMSF